jgi:glucosamine--fructose-6-phosphate aminotransferase (isomerizing)
MNVSRRVLSTAAKRAPSAIAASKVSQRGFAIAATQQAAQNQQQSQSDSHHRVGGLLAVAAAASAFAASNQEKADCCGIAGVVGGSGDAREFLLEGLTILKNRGYDSAGIATMKAGSSEGLVVTKYASVGEKADGLETVREQSKKNKGHSIGIAHTRWATHGGKTDENAHPHVDSSGKIALVHNGTLNNANELRRELQSRGHKFTSQTDTEVIAKLIGEIYEKEGCSVKEATEKAMSSCDGTWGLGIMCTDAPDELVVACNGSPLVIGIGTDRMFIASETSAFNRYTKNFISMKDGEIGVLHADGTTLDLGRMQVAPEQEIKLSPAPYSHWTLKECYEQPEAIGRALGFGGRLMADKITLGGLEKMSTKLAGIDFLTLCACGTSLNASRYAEKLMKHLGSFDVVHSMDAAEIEPSDFPHDASAAAKSAFLVVSQSGETKDVARVVSAAQEKDVSVISVVNAVGSLIARMTKLGVYCNAGRENAVASTKAFTTQVTVLSLIALWFRELKDRVNGTNVASAEGDNLREALMRLPICFGMALKTRDQCKQIAERLNGKDHCFVLGKGYGEPVAMEGALKIKEMCYLHAEGYSGGALKHGPFALIESDENGKKGATPIIMLIFDDDHAHHMRTAAEEVKARGADVIIITDKKSLAEGLDENPLVIPSNGPLTALGAVLPIQLLAFELAMLRGINPDTPRNLAKAVTVD